MMCSARSLGCAIELRRVARVLLGIAGARTRAGDGPGRDARVPDSSSRSGEDDNRVMPPKLHAGGERRGIGAAQRRVDQAPAACPRRGAAARDATDWPGRCRRRRCTPSRDARVPGIAPAAPPPAVHARIARDLGQADVAAASFQVRDQPRDADCVAVLRDRRTASRCRGRTRRRCCTRSANADNGASSARQSQHAARPPAPAHRRDRRPSRP